MDWNKLWNDITAFFTNNVWAIIGFFATLVLGLILIKIVYVAVKRIFARTKMEKIAQQFVLAIIKFLLYLVLILCLLSVAGVEISGIITAVSATLLAVGMALQNNIANLANGIIIVSGHMFKKGDYIIVEDREGSIVDINFLFVTLMTTDNKRITIPNSIIVNNAVVNSGANAQRRVDFTFSVAYESDVELVKKNRYRLHAFQRKSVRHPRQKAFLPSENFGRKQSGLFCKLLVRHGRLLGRVLLRNGNGVQRIQKAQHFRALQSIGSQTAYRHRRHALCGRSFASTCGKGASATPTVGIGKVVSSQQTQKETG